jgi:hypothetical protein
MRDHPKATVPPGAAPYTQRSKEDVTAIAILRHDAHRDAH